MPWRRRACIAVRLTTFAILAQHRRSSEANLDLLGRSGFFELLTCLLAGCIHHPHPSELAIPVCDCVSIGCHVERLQSGSEGVCSKCWERSCHPAVMALYIYLRDTWSWKFLPFREVLSPATPKNFPDVGQTPTAFIALADSRLREIGTTAGRRQRTNYFNLRYESSVTRGAQVKVNMCNKHIIQLELLSSF